MQYARSRGTISVNKWQQGHVDPWWDDSFKNYPYTYSPIKNTWDEQRWKEQGYSNITLNGANYDPSLDSEISKPFLQIMPWQNQGLRFFRMNTLEMFPLHKDHYLRYQEVFELKDSTQVNRCVVFLEDWKSGHYFEIDGYPIVRWHAGDWVSWQDDVEHFAGNIGTESRYTIQITGLCVP